MDAPAEQRTNLIVNGLAAERLREAAVLLANQQDSTYRVAVCQRAADAIAALDDNLRDILDAGGIEVLKQIPRVGRGIAGAIAEMVRTGRCAYRERLRGSAEPQDVFCAIPGIGPELAMRLHEALNVETLERLEAALQGSAARKVVGIGSRRRAMLRASLAQMLARIPPVRTIPAGEPPVDVRLEIDREYRTKAAANELRTIAPNKRFNPKVEAWLPIMHTSRDLWHFAALFSNTSRAHQLGKVRDCPRRIVVERRSARSSRKPWRPRRPARR